MGHLLFLQGRVSKKIMHKYEKESREMGKSSFHFAWVLDETDEERTRGVTTDVAVNCLSNITTLACLSLARKNADTDVLSRSQISKLRRRRSRSSMLPATKNSSQI